MNREKEYLSYELSHISRLLLLSGRVKRDPKEKTDCGCGYKHIEQSGGPVIQLGFSQWELKCFLYKLQDIIDELIPKVDNAEDMEEKLTNFYRDKHDPHTTLRLFGNHLPKCELVEVAAESGRILNDKCSCGFTEQLDKFKEVTNIIKNRFDR